MKNKEIKLSKRFLNKMPANFHFLTTEPFENRVVIRSGFYSKYNSRLSEPTAFYKPISRLIDRNEKNK